MSKSLEALERIETVFVYNKQRKKNCYADFMSESKVIEEYYKDYNTIKQELEHLVQLEKAIQILKSNLYIVFNDSYNGVSFKKDKYDECDYTILCLKDKQQYELLKEMLGNEMVQK